MAELVISVKRSRRSAVDQRWKAALTKISGVEIIGADHPYSVQVVATQAAATEISRRYSDFCHVNPVQYRSPL